MENRIYQSPEEKARVSEWRNRIKKEFSNQKVTMLNQLKNIDKPVLESVLTVKYKALMVYCKTENEFKLLAKLFKKDLLSLKLSH